MKNWNVRKTVVAREDMPAEHRLKQSLGWPHLVALGVGAIVGTGILVLIGTAADRAGPAMILSFVVAGVICICAALAYAEVATMIPASGSAYTYSYVVFGELIAWMIGVALILEYTLVISTVAVGWSGYAAGFLKSIHIGTASLALPDILTHGPQLAGKTCDGKLVTAAFGINVPAIFIIWVVAGLLIGGTRESAGLNALLVVIKMAALALFIIVALPHFNAANFHPFAPYGYGSGNLHCDAASGSMVTSGMMAAAAIIFFAFYGFDAIATAAEEAKNPGRDLAIGIVGSMLVCVVIYMAVAAASIGAVAYTEFSNTAEPLALILRQIGKPWAAQILGISAVMALPTVILAFFYGQSRIFFTVARDGLLPSSLARVSRRGTPVRVTIFTAIVTSLFAGLIPLASIATLANAGTLAAFVAVCAAMLVLRRREPDVERKFRAPLPWLVGVGGILGCIYLFISLPTRTQLFFLTAQVIGLVLYAIYGSRAAERARLR
jgi:APA family basic amino acid/polyamine antiporter